MAEVSPVKYLNIADIKDHWLKVIAPNYFDFDNINNYQTGIFGYVNEVMGEAVEDGFNAVNTARREFYPVTAEYMSSLYKMATLQQIDIPLVTPSTCKAAFVLKQSEIIENSTYENGIYTCVLDSCMKIFADNLQFMFDYPIIILSKKTTDGGWSHTAHYDVSTKNSLNTNNKNRYVANKIIRDSGVNYVILFVDIIRQVQREIHQDVIIKDSILDTTSIEISFDGNLANFEVFYQGSQNSPKQQLQKVLINGTIPPGPFCYYEYVSQNKLRLTFPVGGTFVPEFNSEIETVIYTSEGADGNFVEFKGELVCSSDSEDYPYNATMAIRGIVNGAATGGKNQLLNEEFRTEIIRAYATNHVYTTSNDLQIFFDKTSESITNMKVMFRKKRDDALVRLFGAYVLMKDMSDNVIPSNTLDIQMKKSDILPTDSIATRVMIKPGQQFVYEKPNDPNVFRVIPKPETWEEDMKDVPDEDKFVFTNPFLIGVNLQPNTLGYYLNSADIMQSIEYPYINDDTPNQFIANNLKVYRNAMAGENYYKISISVSPANSDLTLDELIQTNPYDSQVDENTGKTVDTNGIRAKDNGVVKSTALVYEALPLGADDQGNETFTEEKYCFLKTIVEYVDGTSQVIISSNTLCTENDELRTGYAMNFKPGETFIKDDILAVKLVTDLGKLKLVGDFYAADSDTMFDNDMYVPFMIEAEDPSRESAVTCVAYISTSDDIDTNANLEILDGIYNMDGTPNHSVAIPMEKLNFEIHAFYKNDDINFSHKYDLYPYLAGYTLANTYISSENEPISLVQPLTYIRSVIGFYELKPGYDGEVIDENDYGIFIKECPLLKAEWAAVDENYADFVKRIGQVHEKLNQAYTDLENNFSIDMKFYNTYGRSRFYTVGLKDADTPLDNISCTFRFGVLTTVLANQEEFKAKLRKYIKEYVENLDNATAAITDIYIMNLIASMKADFEEIQYVLYYGFNIYDHEAQKIVGPDINAYQENYIPEFINIRITLDEDGLPIPDIEIDLLKQ